MKQNFIVLLASSIFTVPAFSQITAPDWTLTDCSSNSHTLYNYLDSQEVVVMEFSHGCASCTNAAGYLMDIKADYDVSHPGKVNWFFMDYNGNNCSTVNSMISSFDFDAAFINCDPQKDDYYPSIFPMPAIVIAAGNYHTVIFQHNTWVNSDTTDIRSAIDQFFATVGIEEENAGTDLLIYPNPVKENLYMNISDLGSYDMSIKIYNMVGEVKGGTGYRIDKNILMIPVGQLVKGSYVLEISNYSKIVRKVFVKD